MMACATDVVDVDIGVRRGPFFLLFFTSTVFGSLVVAAKAG